MLQDYCIKDVLKRDEFVHYQDLIQELKMGELWSAQSTDKYLERSINELPNQLDKAKSLLAVRQEVEYNRKSKQESERRRSKS